jgi:hypothetical protein
MHINKYAHTETSTHSPLASDAPLPLSAFLQPPVGICIIYVHIFVRVYIYIYTHTHTHTYAYAEGMYTYAYAQGMYTYAYAQTVREFLQFIWIRSCVHM